MVAIVDLIGVPDKRRQVTQILYVDGCSINLGVPLTGTCVKIDSLFGVLCWRCPVSGSCYLKIPKEHLEGFHDVRPLCEVSWSQSCICR